MDLTSGEISELAGEPRKSANGLPLQLTSGGGNSNPWVFGVSAILSDDGSEAPLRGPLNGAVDHVRVSNQHRDFTGTSYQPLRLGGA